MREHEITKTEGGVTAAQGFEAASAAAHIKYEGRTDMALVFSKEPCVTAGTFTTNVVKAAPVIWDRDLVAGGAPAHAVIVNSGIANACTGQEGMEYCRQTAEEASKCLGIDENSVLVGSTGVIGFQLPIDRIRAGVRMLAQAKRPGLEAGTEASKAIMTTDTVNKETAYTFEVGGKKAVIGGMAKGSGMIHPNMCTMLGYVTTDAAIRKELLQKALGEIVQETFNMISVDGDTSTNDTLLVLANGLAGNETISDEESEDYAVFYAALRAVCRELAMKMASDGEGCTKLIETRVIDGQEFFLIGDPLCPVFHADGYDGRAVDAHIHRSTHCDDLLAFLPGADAPVPFPVFPVQFFFIEMVDCPSGEPGDVRFLPSAVSCAGSLFFPAGPIRHRVSFFYRGRHLFFGRGL